MKESNVITLRLPAMMNLKSLLSQAWTHSGGQLSSVKLSGSAASLGNNLVEIGKRYGAPFDPVQIAPRGTTNG